jgi:hypothetical protein
VTPVPLVYALPPIGQDLLYHRQLEFYKRPEQAADKTIAKGVEPLRRMKLASAINR